MEDKIQEYIKKGAIMVEFYFDFNLVLPDKEARERMWKAFGEPSPEVVDLSEGFARKHIYEIAQNNPPDKWKELVEKRKPEIKKEMEEHLLNVASGFVNEFIEQMVKKEKIWFGVGEIEPPIWDKETISNYAVIKLLFRKFSDLIEAVAIYNPVGIEILAPEYLSLDMGEVQSALNTLSNLVYRTKMEMLTDEKKAEFLKAYKLREEIGKRVRERVLNRNSRTG